MHDDGPIEYTEVIENQFGSLDIANFHVSYSPAKVFLCGGEYKTGKLIPQSLRDRLIEYYEVNKDSAIGACVQAEDFKDYLKNSTYSDLLEFEDDIAKISTLIIICLESPGSLVELGLFVNNQYLDNKLIVIAPQDKVEAQDSFIYLGPLKKLQDKDSESVLIYPWPDKNQKKYDHLELIVEDINSKFNRLKKSEKFNDKNIAHMAFLVHDIVLIANPIKLFEIEWCLTVLGIDVQEPELKKILYLLDKIGLVKYTRYSNVKYYYDIEGGARRIKFGRSKDGVHKEESAMKIALRQSYILSSDESDKKRRLALKQIMSLKKGEAL
ncbi:retron St85 family effector protein [Vibrio alginolyticus]|uniref:retron St85 family effector protein n=2 Tax=Vibrionaceae TaxID=641 RepID=UPI00215F73A6|nr:retron St85 family effector protein [Vibrio alginolyticus]MCS0080811.1 retron St85 family effector protein [Vibrio alginolyticus]